MGVNSLPKTVTQQRRDCDLNPGPTVPESSMLTLSNQATQRPQTVAPQLRAAPIIPQFHTTSPVH